MTGRIWLIGGTQESAQLAKAIAQEHFPCTISVTTATARSLYPDVPDLKVWVGRLTSEQLLEFLHKQQIVAVLDASHPYAVEISQLAIATTKQLQIPYLRYERPLLETGRGEGVKREELEGSTAPSLYLDSFDTLLSDGYLQGERVLLTVGYRPLPLFQAWQDQATLFARILPSIQALEVASAAGFTSDRLIAIRPPISFELEKALWQQWQISLVVTKASGTAGGEDIKRQVAAELGVKLRAIARPTVAYPQQTSNLQAALEFCHHSISSGFIPN